MRRRIRVKGWCKWVYESGDELQKVVRMRSGQRMRGMKSEIVGEMGGSDGDILIVAIETGNDQRNEASNLRFGRKEQSSPRSDKNIDSETKRPKKKIVGGGGFGS